LFYLPLQQQREFSGIYLSMGYLHAVAKSSIAHERFVLKFSKRFASFSLLFNHFQTAGGRDTSPVAWAAQAVEVPDPRLFTASH